MVRGAEIASPRAPPRSEPSATHDPISRDAASARQPPAARHHASAPHADLPSYCLSGTQRTSTFTLCAATSAWFFAFLARDLDIRRLGLHPLDLSSCWLFCACNCASNCACCCRSPMSCCEPFLRLELQIRLRLSALRYAGYPPAPPAA